MKAMDKHHFQVSLLAEAPLCKSPSQQMNQVRIRRRHNYNYKVETEKRFFFILGTYKTLDKVNGREDDGKEVDHVWVILCSLPSPSIISSLPS